MTPHPCETPTLTVDDDGGMTMVACGGPDFVTPLPETGVDAGVMLAVAVLLVSLGTLLAEGARSWRR